MDKETYEKQKAFAGEKIASMNRRCVGHDYQGRQIYMITMVTEGRRPLFGQVAGRSDGAPDTPDEPRVELTELGRTTHGCMCSGATAHPRPLGASQRAHRHQPQPMSLAK